MSYPEACTYFVSVIEHLRLNLERYQPDDSGMTLIKEFIQNADDADEAETMHFVWIPAGGDSDAFWDGPAFVIINDGRFTEYDRVNITKFGNLFKAADADKIGKFGLGMKSLHHWSEAYALFTWPNREFYRLINPWRQEAQNDGEDGRRDWEKVSPEQTGRMEGWISKLYEQYGNDKEWFCIWMPLRSERRLCKRTPIRQNWPGDDHVPRKILEQRETPFQIAALLPMLKRLNTITAWIGADDQVPRFERLFSLGVPSRPMLPAYPELLQAHVNGGGISVAIQDQPPVELLVAGFTQNLNDPTLQQLQSEKNWPKGERISQNAAVYFVQNDSRSAVPASLSASMSVFLPLGEPQSAPLQGASGAESLVSGVSLFLHGYFFVDSGRREIYRSDEFAQENHKGDEDGIKMKWNHRLLEEGTLPLFLPALYRFVRANRWNPEQVRTLVDGIKTHRDKHHQSFWKGIDDKVLFCGKSLLCRYVPDVPEKQRWELLDGGRYFELPPVNGRDKTDLEVPEKTFPALRELTKEQVLVFRGSSRLSAATSSENLSVEMVRSLLESAAPVTVFNDPKCLEYFTQFIEQQTPPAPAESIVPLWNRIVRDIAFDDKDNTPEKEAAKRIITRIPDEKRFLIPGHFVSGSLLRSLAMQKIKVALIPEILWTTDSMPSATIAVEDAQRILTQILYWKQKTSLKEDEYRAIAVLVATIWRACQEDLLDKCGDMPLFRGVNAFSKSNEDFSFRQLQQFRDEANLFSMSATVGDAYQLQSALDPVKEIVRLIPTSVYSLLFPDDKSKECNPSRIQQYFKEKPRCLSPTLQDRFKLFSRLRQASVADNKLPLRFLLHGNVDHYDESDTTLFFPGKLEGIAERLSAILRDDPENRWKYLSTLAQQIFGKELSERDKNDLEISQLDTSSIVAQLQGELSDEIKEKIADLKSNDSEYEEILSLLKAADQSSIRKLPIHETVDGRFVAIEAGQTFLEPEEPLDPSLQVPVTLLKRRKDCPRLIQLQHAFVQDLGDVQIISFILAQDRPELFWQRILDIAAKNPSAIGQEKECLHTTVWLPTRKCVAIGLGQIVHLPKLDATTLDGLSGYLEDFFCERDLHGTTAEGTTIQKHPGLVKLQEFFPDTPDSLGGLARILLKKDKRNGIAYAPEDESLQHWCEAFQVADELYPAWSYLMQIKEKYPQEFPQLLEQLVVSSRVERYEEILRFLSKNGSFQSIKDVFHRHLELSMQRGLILEADSPLLPNIVGEWCPPEILCEYGQSGVIKSSRIHEETNHLLADFLQKNDIADLPTSTHSESGQTTTSKLPFEELDSKKYADILEQYFKSWQDYVYPEMIGAFLSVLGGNRFIDQFSRRNLHNWTKETCLKELITRQDDARELEQLRIRVELSDARKLWASNLLGESRIFDRTETPESILFGKIGLHEEENPVFDVHCPENRSRRVASIRLHVISPESLGTYSPEERNRLLAESTRTFCIQVLGQMGLWHGQSDIQERFDKFWTELSKSDQHDIGVYQDLFIEDCHQILKKHFGDLPAEIRKALQTIGESREQKALKKRATQLGKISDQGGDDKFDMEINNARNTIRGIFESEDEAALKARESILKSTRGIISEEDQYSIESIPFEIFQNADDAYSELKYFRPEQQRDGDKCFFEIALEEDRLLFLHDGRRVNQYPPESQGESFDVKGNRYRFGRDVFGMLDLNHSNKYRDATEGAKDQVTGKFGLGFKSVFLLSDRPRILSGHLRFRIEGGVYPVYIGDSEHKDIRELMRLSLSEQLSETQTLVELLFRETQDIQESKKDALAKFEQFVQPLLIFAKKIRRCIINRKTVSWKSPKKIDAVSRCYLGQMGDYDSSLSSNTKTLEFHNDHGSILFAMNSKGFSEFHKDFPTFWVTTPTKERCQVGFLINSASFQIDVGRSRLIEGRENQEIAQEMGRTLGTQLIELYKRSREDWAGLRTELGLSEHANQYDFWDSLWRLLCVNLQPLQPEQDRHYAAKLLLEMFWTHDDSAAVAIFADARYETIPTGVQSNKDRKLVSLTSITRFLKYPKEEHESVLRFAGDWLKGGVTVSDDVRKILCSFRPKISSIEGIGIVEVLKHKLEVEQYKLSPMTASELGCSFHEDKLMELLHHHNEVQEVNELLAKIKFLAVDKQYHLCTELVTAEDDSNDRREEKMRAAFAPDANRLALKYAEHKHALEFFFLCRKMEADAKTLRVWAMSARPEQYKAVLEYILEGRLSYPLQEQLLSSGNLGWMEDLPDHWEELGIGEDDRAILAGKLKRAEQWLRTDDPPPEQPPPRPIDAEVFLSQVSEWWQKNQDEHLAKYRKNLFPGNFKMLMSDDCENVENRKSWIVLFLLAISYTMGRTHSGQHRSFVEKCVERKWLDVFACSSEPSYDKSRWMDVIEEYFEYPTRSDMPENQHLQWMKNFPCIYAVSRYLDDYITLFSSVGMLSEAFHLSEITDPAQSSLLSRRGFSPKIPSITRILGPGACFVMRELVHREVVVGEFLHEHCYAPQQNLRMLFLRLGCPGIEPTNTECGGSKKIHRFLAKHLGKSAATFNNCFDIPFQVILANEELQRQFGID